ncbi:MAG TPA: S1/P1 nuclease [Nitrospira sp.]|nr:S1/P1 nuclease [Nitrospira sp.]
MKLILLTCLLIIGLTSRASAWNDFGHMIVAAIAYDHLTPTARAQVDALLKLNPSYPDWVTRIDRQDRRKVAFIKAATWPDMIKIDYRYREDGDRPKGPDAGRNIGYADKLIHRYWHYIDIPFSLDGTALTDPDIPNAQTQIVAFRQTLKDAGASDDLKSYALVWLLHLVADVHQPLHATTRFTQKQPNGDRGGNDVKVCTATGCGGKLHRFWDDLLGTSEDYKAAIDKAKALEPAETKLAGISDEAIWIEESVLAAKQTAYATPIGPEEGPYDLTDTYKAAAREVAERRIALAGIRLANLLNDALNGVTVPNQPHH